MFQLQNIKCISLIIHTATEQEFNHLKKKPAPPKKAANNEVSGGDIPGQLGMDPAKPASNV